MVQEDPGHPLKRDYIIGRPKRRESLLRPAARAVDHLSRYFEIEVEGGENFPPEGGALIVAKHSHAADPLLHGYALWKETGRYSNYFMKRMRFGNQILEKYGGLMIAKSGDPKFDAHERREHNDRLWGFVDWLYLNDEIITSYQEGRVIRPVEGGERLQAMGQLKKGVLHKTRDFQRRTRKGIPVLPLGIEYNGFARVGSLYLPKFPAVIRVGEPRLMDDDILENDEAFEEFIRQLGVDMGELSGGLPYYF